LYFILEIANLIVRYPYQTVFSRFLIVIIYYIIHIRSVLT